MGAAAPGPRTVPHVFSPALAAGAAAAAVAVPLVIHLLFRKRYQVVPWAAVRFLLVAERRHRRRIDQWLLLALRVCGLLLPLFAMVAATGWAEQLWQRVKPGATETVANLPRTHHVLVLDGSLSMTARGDDGKTRYENAVAAAEGLVRGGNPGDGYTLLFLAGQPQAVVPGPANEADKVVAELKRLKATHAAADVAPVLAMVADVLARSPRAYPRRQVTFFTDLQRTAWAGTLPRSDSPVPELWQRIHGKAEVAVVDLAKADADPVAENLAVSDLSIGDPLPLANAPASVTATVHNYGRTERRLVRVELALGRPGAASDSLAPLDTKVIDAVPAGGRAAVTFTLDGPTRFRDRGLHVLQAKLPDGDALAADDTRSLVVEVRDGLQVVVVNGKADPEPLRRAAEHLSRALAPPGARPSETPARPRTLSPSEFADPALGDLSGVDCVFLCDVPVPTPVMVAKLDAHLKRGGGVVIGLGPNAYAGREVYNRVLYADGNGLLPGPLGGLVAAGPDEPGFRLTADEEVFRRPPLVAFRDDNARAGLFTAPFKSYLKLDAPPDGRARRLLLFLPAGAAPASAGQKLDPAVVEWGKHRGRVVVYTSSFNQDWTEWPVLPSYLPFVHETLRFAAANPDRHTVRVGEPLEEFYPLGSVGLGVGVTGPDGLTATGQVAALDEVGVVRFGDTTLSGLYRLGVGPARDRVFAVNVPETLPAGGSESDLRRLDVSELKAVGPVQVVGDSADIVPTGEGSGTVVSAPKPHGPAIARVAMLLALAVLAAELFLAWRFGPSRSAAGGAAKPVERRWHWRVLSTALALLPLAAAGFVLFVLLHAERTGNLLGFLPDDSRRAVEAAAGVPEAAPGEGTRWRLEGFTAFVRNSATDRRIVLTIAAAALVLTVLLYRSERQSVASGRRLVIPGLLRTAAFLVALFLLLPQLRLAFDREGWPEVVILLDTSGSMGTVDAFGDPAVKARAEELCRAADLPEGHRLKLAQLLLARKDADWLDTLLREKQVRVYVFAVDSQTRLVADLDEAKDAAAARGAMQKLTPDGTASALGDGVQAVLKSFRGSSLAALVMFTDGVVTAGDDLQKAGREAARAGVPLYLVGVGDTREVPDLGLTALQVEDVVTRGDRLVFGGRLTARGQVPTQPVPVVLYERQGEKLVERGRASVAPNPSAGFTDFRIAHTPAEPGERAFVLEVGAAPGEVELGNNKIERTIVVTETKRIRVLYLEGETRYDFRYVKVLLERESDRVAGNKSVELKTVLLSASKGWTEIDRSALADFPTRDQLFEYDVVILGDFDPRPLPKASRMLLDLADFVRVKGGGLLVLAGETATPAAFAETPLADVLPVVPAEGEVVTRSREAQPITEGYRPKLTPGGQLHPLFRFSTDDTESARVWARLQPLFWYAKGYKRKLTAEVLAVHPDRPAEDTPGEGHPLVLQQFSGAGRVVFLGFDETWRWRWRNDEEQFNRFWLQAVRLLARSRVGRVELRLDKQTAYRRDEKIQVTVRFPDDAPPPPADAPVRVMVQRGPLPKPDGTPGAGDAESSSLALTKVEGTRATFTGAVTRTPDGEYRFMLSEPDAGASRPRAEAKVLPPPTERDRLEMDRAELTAAAALSNGGFYTLDDAENVFRDLKNLNRVPLNQPCPPVPLWNQPAAYLLVVLLLAAEWLLRKRERLL
jgi:hypothetical protein